MNNLTTSIIDHSFHKMVHFPLERYRIDTISRSSLIERTLNSLDSTFRGRGLSLDAEMWQGLEAAIEVMANMAEGRCAPAYYVSSLDPGVGKTTAMVHFLRELMSSEGHRDVSALVCLGRLDQIKKVSEEAGLLETDYAVLTANPDLNALGCGSPEQGRLLITTHAMIESRCSKRRFSDISALKYQGSPRQVRIWDEAILPGVPVTVGRDDVASLFKAIRSSYPKLVEALEGFFLELKGMADNIIIDIPPYAEDFEISHYEISSLVASSEGLQATAEGLWYLMGRKVVVRVDGQAGPTLVEYRDTLPNDIKPILALDASARVRATYSLWEQHRGDLVRLPQALKRYNGLTLHVWDQGGGKSAYRSAGSRIVEGVLSAISERPQEPWLVVHHKFNPKDQLDLPKEVTKSLNSGHRVSFLNWGAHDGTNEFKDVTNVILAGTLFRPKSYHEGLARLAKSYPAHKGSLSHRVLREVEAGENCHLILQALCRSAVRQMREGGCPPVHAYLIASKRTGISESLPEIFPGSHIVDWNPIAREPRGKVADAIQFIVQRFSDQPNQELAYTDVREALGIKDRSNFNRTIRNHRDFRAALERLDLEERGTQVHRTHLRKRLAELVAAA